jgi:hypothetical protein
LTKKLIFAAALAVPVAWTVFGKMAVARFASKASFSHCVADQRIVCEPGSQSLAELISPSLPTEIDAIEVTQFNRFDLPILIYTYATRQSFAKHSGAADYAGAATSNGAIHVSPKLLSTPERGRGILTHELSHLNLLLRIGSWSMASLPSWFTEGLATFVSNGGGAETVTDEQAHISLQNGKHFLPNEAQFALRPMSGDSFELEPHMFYRQSALFVAFLRDRDPVAFERCLRSIIEKHGFKEAFTGAYHLSLTSGWNEFQSTR